MMDLQTINPATLAGVKPGSIQNKQCVNNTIYKPQCKLPLVARRSCVKDLLMLEHYLGIFKKAIVHAALRGLISSTVADWIIQRGGLSHV